MMNRDSVDLKIFATGNEAAEHGAGGASWDEDRSHLYLVMPGRGTFLDAIPVTRDPAKVADRVWLLTGPDDRPTLSPSLHAVGQWHGWLKEGRLVSC